MSKLFMKSKPPPPEELIEEQPSYNNLLHIHAAFATRGGQRLTIPDREVTKLGFWLYKVGTISGDIYLTIRNLDDDILCSQYLMDANDLTGTATYYEVTFGTPAIINEEVRILCEFAGGDAGNRVELNARDTDIKAGEYFTYFVSPDYTALATWDCAYRYKYYEV